MAMTCCRISDPVPLGTLWLAVAAVVGAEAPRTPQPCALAPKPTLRHRTEGGWPSPEQG